MNDQRFTRRSLLKGAAVAVAAPYVITSTALGNADTPPASERVTLGHIGVGNRGGSLFGGFMHCKGAQSVAVADCLQGPPRGLRPDAQGQGLRRFPRTAGPRRHRRRGRRHARPLARADRHRRRPGEEGRLRREAAGPDASSRTSPAARCSRRTSRIFQYGTQQRSIAALPLRLRVGPQRADRQGAHDRGRSRPTAARADRPQEIPVPPNARLRHVARPGADEALHGRPLPPARAPTGSTTTRSAIWPAGAPIRWTSWSGAATPTWPAR